MSRHLIPHFSSPGLPTAGLLISSKASREFQCSSCTKTFRRNGDRARHEQLHTGIKPHACDFPECGKEFSQRSGLKTHMNVHTRVKPYTCGIDACSAKFGDPSSCARHKKETHRLKYPYKCPAEGCICRIKRRSAFKKHLKAKHDINPEGLDIDVLAKPSKTSFARRESISPARTPISTSYTPTAIVSEEPRSVIQSPIGEQLHNLKPDDVWYSKTFGFPQIAVETYQSPPDVSDSDLSGNFSAQSSSETLVEDLKYPCSTPKSFYPSAEYHTPSSSSSSSSSPRLSTPQIPQMARLDMVNSAQEAYDRQRYQFSTGVHADLFHMDHKHYGFPQEIDYFYSPPQQWQQTAWGYA